MKSTNFISWAGFLTAMRQEVTRAHKGWALDMVSLHNDATKFLLDEIKAPPLVNIIAIFTFSFNMHYTGTSEESNFLLKFYLLVGQKVGAVFIYLV